MSKKSQVVTTKPLVKESGCTSKPIGKKPAEDWVIKQDLLSTEMPMQAADDIATDVGDTVRAKTEGKKQNTIIKEDNKQSHLESI